MPQTKRDIQGLLSGAGISPLKRFGQHFLIDGNLMVKLAGAAGVTRDDVVLEVGPGTGSLTELLLDAAGHVVAVEIDRGLHAILDGRWGQSDRLTLICGDVLARKTVIAPEVMRALAERQAALGGRIMLVANLPYQVATPLLIDLLFNDITMSPMCVTVQAEVADRLRTGPGSRDYGAVSIFAQAWADVKRIARIPPEAFWPVPKVDSAMLRLDIDPARRPASAVRRRLADLVHACFTHRRKTMRFTLRAMLDPPQLERVEADGRWDLSHRPEQIDVGQWIALARFLAD